MPRAEFVARHKDDLTVWKAEQACALLLFLVRENSAVKRPTVILPSPTPVRPHRGRKGMPAVAAAEAVELRARERVLTDDDEGSLGEDSGSDAAAGCYPQVLVSGSWCAMPSMECPPP